MSLSCHFQTVMRRTSDSAGSSFPADRSADCPLQGFFLKNPPILIFDEATSALDNESEKSSTGFIGEACKNRTTFVIAHRLSTIKNAEKIIVLSEDGIEESGTHEELMDRKGTYEKAFYNMQFHK